MQYYIYIYIHISVICFHIYMSLGTVDKFSGWFFDQYVRVWLNSAILYVVFLCSTVIRRGEFGCNIVFTSVFFVSSSILIVIY